jgi:hypothetical protein
VRAQVHIVDISVRDDTTLSIRNERGHMFLFDVQTHMVSPPNFVVKRK